MGIDRIVTIGSAVVTIASAGFGVYQWCKSRKLAKIIRQNAWSFYRDASVIFGGLQRLQQKMPNNQDAISKLSQLTGQAEEMMNNQIRQININEEITKEKVDKWLEAGRLCDPSHRDVFNKFVES